MLLHGVGLDHTVWSRVESRLGRTTSAIDLPGHGRQPRLSEPTDLAEMAADVLERMPAGPVHLVGFSLGSLIAQQIAIESPERVRSLACVSSVCARTDDDSAAVRGRLEGAGADFPGSMERALERWFPAEAAAEAGAASSGGVGNSIAKAVDSSGGGVAEVLREEIRPVLFANDPVSYRHAYAVFATGDRELAPRLGEITAPTLAITGELDPGSTPEMSRRLAERIPDTRVVVVPGARHMLPVTHAEVLAGHLGALIDSTATGAGTASRSTTAP
ncbi:alpha/beta hydrolase [Brevibacterium sp. S22]|nr:alpha/beta hydrolase [Brevibacterium sp. S22]